MKNIEIYDSFDRLAYVYLEDIYYMSINDVLYGSFYERDDDIIYELEKIIEPEKINLEKWCRVENLTHLANMNYGQYENYIVYISYSYSMIRRFDFYKKSVRWL